MRETIDGGIERRHITIEGLPTSMTAGKVLVLIATTLALVLVMSGCSGQGSALQNCLDQVATIPAPASDAAALSRLTAQNSLSAGCRFADAARKLEDADQVRHNANILAGKLNARGLLSDADLEKYRAASKAAGKLWEAARDALAAARQAGESGTWLAAFADAQRAIAALSDLTGGSL